MENRKIPNEAINAAAEWWMKRISGQVTHDNGDNSFGSVFAGMLADQMVKPASDDQLQRFKNSLVIRLSVMADQGRKNIWMDSDYSPDITLSAAAVDADIPKDNFPWKTNMRIEKDRVEVKNGYGMPWVRIWPVEHNENEKEGAA